MVRREPVVDLVCTVEGVKSILLYVWNIAAVCKDVEQHVSVNVVVHELVFLFFLLFFFFLSPGSSNISSAS